MNKTNEKLNNHEKTLLTAVISAFRSINPSQNSAYNWYSQIKPLKSSASPVSKPVISTYYVPIFGSVFASALAFVMIITSQNNQNTFQQVSLQRNTISLSSETQHVSSFSAISNESSKENTQENHVLAKIDAQTKGISRTQADESFTESLNVETSLQDLFE